MVFKGKLTSLIISSLYVFLNITAVCPFAYVINRIIFRASREGIDYFFRLLEEEALGQ